MGTGIVSVLIHQLPFQFTGLVEISTVFFFLNIIIFVMLFISSVVRYAVWPEIWGLMLRHPVQSLFLCVPQMLGLTNRGAIPMGLATIITMIIYVAVPYSHSFVALAESLFWIDVVLSLLSCFGVPLYMYSIVSFY
jgi:tellurite resistance protein TehA-like permease